MINKLKNKSFKHCLFNIIFSFFNIKKILKCWANINYEVYKL